MLMRQIGETFMLEEEKGFCLVVDGLVQVFVKSNAQSLNSTANMLDDDEDSDEQTDGGQGYQLLTEVKNGAPLSSLFTILSLFTEDVQLRQAEEDTNHLTPRTPDVIGKQSSYNGLLSSASAPHSPHFSHHELSEGLRGIAQNVKCVCFRKASKCN